MRRPAAPRRRRRRAAGASVISARWWTVELSMSTLTIPHRGFADEQPGDQEDERSGDVRGREPLRQDRPAEDHDRAARGRSSTSICGSDGAFGADEYLVSRARARRWSRLSIGDGPAGDRLVASASRMCHRRAPRRSCGASSDVSAGCSAISRTSSSSRPNSSIRAITVRSAVLGAAHRRDPHAGLQLAVDEGGAQRRAGDALEGHLVHQISHGSAARSRIWHRTWHDHGRPACLRSSSPATG